MHAGQIYAYRVAGPFDPENGLRFDPSKVLLDPYGRSVAVPKNYNRDAAGAPGDNVAWAMKNMVVDPHAYSWEHDLPLCRPSSRTIIYEMHVAGFTRHPSSGVSEEARHLRRARSKRSPILQELGITAVELFPYSSSTIRTARGIGELLGIRTGLVFLSAPGLQLTTRTDSVRSMNSATWSRRCTGPVLRSSSTSSITTPPKATHTGPTLSLPGLDNPTYYILERRPLTLRQLQRMRNTLNGNHHVVRRMIHRQPALLGRRDARRWLSLRPGVHPGPRLLRTAAANPPLLWDIESDPALAGTKLIAEAWDAGGLYQVGSFIGDTWKEWNGRFRDDVRSFFRGENGSIRRFADRLLGSPEIYGHEGREAEQSINFVTCHDGFTLNDLVSYNEKHNEANREGNRDGSNDNLSWNCGVEGASDDPVIENLRNRQVKNFLGHRILALGVPMILMGDEVRRTQHGNNNAYCQDNEMSWFDWTLVEKHAGVLRFVSLLTQRRLLRDDDAERERLTLNELVLQAFKSWHGVKLNQPDWSDNSHSLALSVEVRKERILFHMILNAYWDSLDFELPAVDGGYRGPWRRWIDTSLDSPDDIVEWDHALPVSGDVYRAGPRSTVVLIAGERG